MNVQDQKRFINVLDVWNSCRERHHMPEPQTEPLSEEDKLTSMSLEAWLVHEKKLLATIDGLRQGRTELLKQICKNGIKQELMSQKINRLRQENEQRKEGWQTTAKMLVECQAENEALKDLTTVGVMGEQNRRLKAENEALRQRAEAAEARLALIKEEDKRSIKRAQWKDA